MRTIRHWDAGRCRVPWSAVRLLRLLRAGELGGLLDGWDGWTLFRDRLVSPDGRAYRERDMRQLWLTLTQAALFREGYDRATGHAGGAAASAGARPFPADSARTANGADRETAAAVGAPSPLPCQTALPACASKGAGQRGGAADALPVALGFITNATSVTFGGEIAQPRGLTGGAS